MSWQCDNYDTVREVLLVDVKDNNQKHLEESRAEKDVDWPWPVSADWLTWPGQEKRISGNGENSDNSMAVRMSSHVTWEREACDLEGAEGIEGGEKG